MAGTARAARVEGFYPQMTQMTADKKDFFLILSAVICVICG
jgi:hypothetical protein